MVSKILIFCFVVAVSTAITAQAPPAVGMTPWIPPWVASAPWYPKWAPCTTIGADCLDCSTKIICTKMGAIEKKCTDPTLPHCNLGQCSATPTAECGPVPAVPATTA